MPELIQKTASTFDIQDSRPIKIWSEDEARFGRMSNPKRCWAPEKVRPIVLLQRIREYLYVFSATCSQTGENYSMIMPLCNTSMMDIFLQGLSEQYKDFRNIIIVDRAAWHMTKRLPQHDNIRFIYLPSGSPELNPTEHFWDHIREKYLGNRIFNSLDDLENEMVDILIKTSEDLETIKNLVGFHWIPVT